MTSAAGMLSGQLFNIQRFSLDDGPGIRSTVFFKGCNQHCGWCHNPESLRPAPQLMRKQSLCVRCGACITACPNGANVRIFSAREKKENGTNGIYTTIDCDGCGQCVGVCPVRALKIMGYTMTVAETMQIILKDRRFYEKSGGGVTFSGGEPSCQAQYLLALLEECGREGIHRAIETNGNTALTHLEQISANVDYVMVDLKHTDDAKHRAFTGAGNARTLAAIAYYLKHNETEVRIPVIPGFNDTKEELQEMLRFLADAGAGEVTLLPYHTYGISKYESLGMDYPLAETEALEKETVQALADAVDPLGIRIKVK